VTTGTGVDPLGPRQVEAAKQKAFSEQNLSLVWEPLHMMRLSFGFYADCHPALMSAVRSLIAGQVDLLNRYFLEEMEVGSPVSRPLQTHCHPRHQCRISPWLQTVDEPLPCAETSKGMCSPLRTSSRSALSARWVSLPAWLQRL
jgi:hypothetical protein